MRRKAAECKCEVRGKDEKCLSRGGRDWLEDNKGAIFASPGIIPTRPLILEVLYYGIGTHRPAELQARCPPKLDPAVRL